MVIVPAYFLVPSSVVLVAILYLVFINRALLSTSSEIEKTKGRTWTSREILEAYTHCQESSTDFSTLLPPRTNRRYIVVGGSGLVGGWIVQHLLLRGENAAHIRIIDLHAPKRAELSRVHFIQVDITNATAVNDAFQLPWPDQAGALTVFHTAAYIDPTKRHTSYLAEFLEVNVKGTKNVVDAASSVGCSILVATSSAAIALKPISFFTFPWSTAPRNWLQISQNAEPTGTSLKDFTGCYAYSKALAEKVVLEANNSCLRTGTIRPGHAIYGYGDEVAASVAYDYLRRGKSYTWLSDFAIQFVSAQNVSLAHLLFESQLIQGRDVGGQGYAISDHDHPTTYGQLYAVLSILAHPSKHVSFPRIAPLPVLLCSYLIELYVALQQRSANMLPALPVDLQTVQPALFQVCTRHVRFKIDRAREELGYLPAQTTLEGLCLQVKDWNERIARESIE